MISFSSNVLPYLYHVSFMYLSKLDPTCIISSFMAQFFVSKVHTMINEIHISLALVIVPFFCPKENECGVLTIRVRLHTIPR
jgi:hypothetical protein